MGPWPPDWAQLAWVLERLTSGLPGLLLDGQTVRLSTDPSQDERDRYDRLLAYVTLTSGPNKGRDFGSRMLQQGHAREYTYSRLYHRQARYGALEEAREERRGLWSSCL